MFTHIRSELLRNRLEQMEVNLAGALPGKGLDRVFLLFGAADAFLLQEPDVNFYDQKWEPATAEIREIIEILTAPNEAKNTKAWMARLDEMRKERSSRGKTHPLSAYLARIIK